MIRQRNRIVLLLIFTLVLLNAGNAQCLKNNAFKEGEVLHFKGYYNWGFIWVNAGKVQTSVTQTNYEKQSAYAIRGVARNANAFEMFFKLRDSLTTIVNKDNLLPYSLDRITNEGNYHTRHRYVYQYSQKKIKAYIKKNEDPQKNFDITLDGCVNNLMSVLFYARNIDYDNLRKGQVIPLQLLVDGKISKVEIRYKGTGKVKLKNGKKVKCYKITPILPNGSMFKEGDGMLVWLSKDKNRVPVMVEAKIPVGSVKGILQEYSGLRHKDNVFGNTAGNVE